MTYWRRWIQREVLWHFQRWCCWCVHQTHDRHVSAQAQNSLKQQTRTSARSTTLYYVSSEYDCHLLFFLIFVWCFPSPENIMIFLFQITLIIPWKKNVCCRYYFCLIYVHTLQFYKFLRSSIDEPLIFFSPCHYITISDIENQ